MDNQPIETQRQAVSQLRRWCPVALLHQDIDDHYCNSEGGCGIGRYDTHRLRLRRMLVCSVCEMAFFKQEEFNAHECFSAY